ncbi:MAG TPA: hypothetical protein VGL86_31640 [Polyangia bacterium]
MRLVLAFAVALASAGCVSGKCHTPTAWKPCSGDSAEPGATGTPPTIVSLDVPTCAFLDSPSVSASLHVTDPDGDAQVIEVSYFNGGVRVDESNIELDDADRSDNDWSGSFGLLLMAPGGGMPMPGSDDVRVKVTDRQGGQSAPFCNSIAIVN